MDTTKDTPKSERFEIYGVNHLALMSSDMDRTVRFYQGLLGFPLVKTLDMSNGGQHFFFDISEGNGIAFFWMPESPAPAPGIAGAGWDPVTGMRSPVSAVGSMHHLAFDVPLEKLEEYRDKLRAEGIEVTEVTGTSDDDECIKTIYFPDPDGFVIGFAAWTRPLTPADVKHEPARAEVVTAATATREKAARAGA